ncbi:MAG TPA: hypothetical protein IAB96_08720 [Candidatus Coprenecus pullicola]|nr:hypothetical protein [Candidatus Coprenecus pullicola]
MTVTESQLQSITATRESRWPRFLSRSVSRYSLDPESGHLYLLEPDSETIIRYNIADLRSILPKE